MTDEVKFYCFLSHNSCDRNAAQDGGQVSGLTLHIMGDVRSDKHLADSSVKSYALILLCHIAHRAKNPVTSLVARAHRPRFAGAPVRALYPSTHAPSGQRCVVGAPGSERRLGVRRQHSGTDNSSELHRRPIVPARRMSRRAPPSGSMAGTTISAASSHPVQAAVQPLYSKRSIPRFASCD